MGAQTQASKNALHEPFERHHNTSTSLAALWRPALLQAFVRLDPRQLLCSPAMLVVELTAVLAALLCLVPDQAVPISVALQIALWLWFTVLFVSFAEALAEGRGKAHADGLRAGSQDFSANKWRADDSFESVATGSLHKGDVVRVQTGEMIPGDDEVIRGVATISEATITDESTPTIHEPGGNHSAVVGDIQVVSDWLLMRVGANPDESALDRMIALVEGTKRQKTPNEIALDILLIGLTLIFLLVMVTLKPLALFADGSLSLVFLVALLVILIPAAVGGLLSAIGIAGMDRLVCLNVIAKSGRAVEATGDAHVLLLDKTGTITLGSRRCSALYATPRVNGKKLAEGALLASLADDTPEGESIVEHLRILRPTEEPRREELTPIAFSAETRLSEVDWNGQVYHEGAVGVALHFIDLLREKISEVLSREMDKIIQSSGTPLLVAASGRLLGAIHLKNVVKPGIRERFAELHRLGIRTVMVTSDNSLTAVAVAAKAGVDDVIAETTPREKLARIRQEQGEGHLVAIYGDDASNASTLAQANVDMAMSDGTQAAHETANLVDLGSDPTKLLNVVQVGRELLVTRGVLTTFSIVSDVAKYFAVLSVLFVGIYPQLDVLNMMRLQSLQNAILSTIVFNALVIVALVPPALHGVRVQAAGASQLLQRNLLIYGVDGLVAPFPGVKMADLLLTAVDLV